MVADMTTFMARLVNKLCETSANQINSLMQANQTEDCWSKTIPLPKLNTVKIDKFLSFESNTSLLEDQNIDIPNVV